MVFFSSSKIKLRKSVILKIRILSYKDGKPDLFVSIHKADLSIDIKELVSVFKP